MIELRHCSRFCESELLIRRSQVRIHPGVLFNYLESNALRSSFGSGFSSFCGAWLQWLTRTDGPNLYAVDLKLVATTVGANLTVKPEPVPVGLWPTLLSVVASFLAVLSSDMSSLFCFSTSLPNSVSGWNCFFADAVWAASLSINCPFWMWKFWRWRMVLTWSISGHHFREHSCFSW